MMPSLRRRRAGEIDGPSRHARFPCERSRERGPTMRPTLRSSLVLALVAGGSFCCHRPLPAQNAADPAAVAKTEEAQKGADAPSARRMSAVAVDADEHDRD